MSKRVVSIVTLLVVFASVLLPADRAEAQVIPAVVLSEIHYHPQAVGTVFPDFDDREDTEFLEILNLESTPVNLSGWCFDQGVEYCFAPGTTIAASSTLVLADDAGAFDALYGFTPTGVYSGRLSNSGEQLRLVTATGATVAEVGWTTSNPWPVTPDGNGPSLELQSAAGDLASPANWAASSSTNGNPGQAPSLVSASPPLVSSHVVPELVNANQTIPVTVAALNATSMTLVYNVDYGANQSLAMTSSGNGWQATLPALTEGGFIRYRFEAGGPGGTATSPRADDVVDWWAVAVASPQPHAVPVLDLFISPTNWDNIENQTCPCTGAVSYEGQIWTDVAFRRAGFTSINLPKGHLRMDFPAGHPFTANFLDGPVDELTLDAGHTNHEQLREQLSWDFMDQVGFPPIRNEHVRVHRSGDFHGLFLLREEQDGNWRARHDLDRGALYKVEAWSPSTFGFSGLWTKKEGLNESDADIMALATCVNQSGAALRQCLMDTTDVPQIINELAAIVVTWQTDQREFNFFVYRDNTQNQLWRMLPDDLDRSWGAHTTGNSLLNLETTTAKPYRRCVGTDPTPANEICRAFMNVPEFKDMYLRRIRTLTDEVLAQPYWQDRILAQAAYIEDDWADDENKWNRTANSFNAMVTTMHGWVPEYVAHIQAGGHEGNVPAAQSSAPQVAITDYRSDPGDGLGYIMISNPSGSESVDLSNWTVAGLAEIPAGLVVLPGSTVVVSTNDQQFRTLRPDFTGTRAETQGTIAGEVTLIRRDGSVAATTGERPPSPLVLNEWNAVSSSNILAGGDATLGSVVGNGGDWFELVVVEDALDVRGWRLVLSDDDSGAQAVSDEFIFSDAPLLADLEAGTIITVSESFADDVSFVPAAGDWHLNFQANTLDEGGYFTAASQSNFATNHKNWRLSIFDDQGTLVFGPAGEGIGAALGINSSEIGELQVDPSTAVDPLVDFGDGDSSTYGLPNVAAGVEQDLSALRHPYVWMDVNCSGTVSIADAVRIAQFTAAVATPIDQCPLTDPSTQIYIGAADVDANGVVSIGDAVSIAQCIVGLNNLACP